MFELNGIPQGFGMALTRNAKAMENFSHLNETEKKRIIELSHSVRSKDEMNRIVNKLEKGRDSFF